MNSTYAHLSWRAEAHGLAVQSQMTSHGTGLAAQLVPIRSPAQSIRQMPSMLVAPGFRELKICSSTQSTLWSLVKSLEKHMLSCSLVGHRGSLTKAIQCLAAMLMTVVLKLLFGQAISSTDASQSNERLQQADPSILRD